MTAADETFRNGLAAARAELPPTATDPDPGPEPVTSLDAWARAVRLRRRAQARTLAGLDTPEGDDAA